MRTDKNKYILLLLALVVSTIGLSCQLATEPTAVTVPATLTVILRDQAGNALPGAQVFLLDSAKQGVSQTSYDDAASTAAYKLTVPILGEDFVIIADAPPATTLTHYTPLADTLKFKMPCRDSGITLAFDRTDSIPCGTLTASQTLDFGTICIDRDTTINLSAGYFKHDCPIPATIASITTPIINGLIMQAVFSRLAGCSYQYFPNCLAFNESHCCEGHFY